MTTGSDGFNGYKCHPKETQYTSFPNAHGTFSTIDNMLRHLKSLNKFKKIEIISSIFSNHNGIQLDMNYKEKTENLTKMWMLNDTLLNNE